MIKKTILIALRSLRKHPGHTAINIIGLTLGLAVFILITLSMKFLTTAIMSTPAKRTVLLTTPTSMVLAKPLQAVRAL